ncbi:hypothetical protein GCM10028792_33850 [Salinisphaera aquimarina]
MSGKAGVAFATVGDPRRCWVLAQPPKAGSRIAIAATATVARALENKGWVMS